MILNFLLSQLSATPLLSRVCFSHTLFCSVSSQFQVSQYSLFLKPDYNQFEATDYLASFSAALKALA